MMLCALAILEFNFYYLQAIWSFLLAWQDEDPTEDNQKLKFARNFSMIWIVSFTIVAIIIISTEEKGLWIYALAILPTLAVYIGLVYSLHKFKKCINEV